MADIHQLQREIEALRSELHAAVGVIRAEARERKLIEDYLQAMTSTSEWRPWEKRLNSWFPVWGWFHSWRMMYREPFAVWAEDRRFNECEGK